MVFDKEHLERGNQDNLVILGYISLAQKVLSIPDGVSNQFRKKVDGLSAKIHGQQILGKSRMNSALKDSR